MKRCTDLLTLYFQQPCLDKGGRYAVIKPVGSYKEERLSVSKGNVNLTDYWYTMLDGFQEQDLSYTCQHIGLLSDMDPETETGPDPDWWESQIGSDKRWICLCFIKLNLENENYRQAESQMKELVEDHKCFKTFGNADFIFAYSNESEAKLKERLKRIQEINERSREDTGKNVFFSNYYLYGKFGKTQDGAFKVARYEVDNGGGCQTHELIDKVWCARIIGQLRKYIERSRKAKNEKMMAYYQGLGQIVNIIAQYEQPEIYKDLFFMFFPPICLFMQQLQKAEREIEGYQNGDHDSPCEGKTGSKSRNEKYEKMNKMERSISEFIDSMEVLLHHMGHSCRDILSDAGRGGIPYDIPIRLCLMYTAYLHVLTRVMNDEGYEFEYCLSPLTYSRPGTEYLDFGLEPGDRLIQVRISKHMMFVPRSLFIILAHEASHYVSNVPRARKLRAECLVKIANMAMVNNLLPEDILDTLRIGGNAVLQAYLEKLQQGIYDYLDENLWKNWENRPENDHIFYLEEFSKDLERKARRLLEGEGPMFSWILDYVDNDTVSSLRDESGQRDLFRDISAVQSHIKVQKMILWDKKPLHEFMDSVERNLKEVYADLSAILLLKLTPDKFLEAYISSESYVPNEDVITPELLNRIAMVKYVLIQQAEEDQGGENAEIWENWKNWNTSEETQRQDVDVFLQKLKRQVDAYIQAYSSAMTGAYEPEAEPDDNGEFFTCDSMFGYLPVFALETKYFTECFTRLKSQLQADTSKARQELLLNLFRHFQIYEESQETSYASFFEDYEALIECYRGEIRTDYQKKIKEFYGDEALAY